MAQPLEGAPVGDLVGIVVVSHSRRLALAAVELAGQMVHGQGPRVAVAAGLDEQTLGTDAMAIKDALERVDGPAGVVVLMDLGSAVLSADLALDLADDPGLRERVTLSPAPLVEGLVAAVVTAAGGGTRLEVAAEAANALAGKESQLAAPDTAPVAPPAPAPDHPAEGSSSGELTITMAHGLHARPVARLVGALRGLDATVSLTNLTTGAGPAPGSSLTRVTLLAALHGHRLRVDADGPDADEAVRRLVDLAARSFDEQTPAGPGARQRFAVDEADGGPVGASPGVVVGPVRHLHQPAPDTSSARPPSGDPLVEWRRLTGAIEATRAGTEAVREATARDVGEDEAAIFDAHLALLADESLLQDVRGRVDADQGAVDAWSAAIETVERQLRALPDPYLRARAADVRGVGDQVLRALLGSGEAVLTGVGVLVADDLTPAQTAGLDRRTVQAIVLARGSRTSHAAILARAKGIPAIVSAGDDVLALPEGTLVALDGDAGTLVVRPDEAVVAEYKKRRHDHQQQQDSALAAAGAPARTADGVGVHVACNVGSVDDARVGGEQGADGAGLVRTELCFVGRADEPDVEEQEALYLAVAEALGGRRITLRTLDVGGDKPLPYLPVPPEDNPFLGLRGLRLSLVRPDVLRRQLTAIARVARQTPVSIMFPMVSTVDELRRARAHLDAVTAAEGVTRADALRVGIMVEVPAVALKLHAFAGLLDFVSIGTNDLTQYALAAERGNPHVAALSDPLDPGVLALVAAAGRAGHGRFPVAVCGEAGSDPLAVPLLLGLGVGELSVSPYAVPAVKQRVRALDLAVCTELAQAALAAESGEQVRQLVRERLGT